MRLKIYQVDAFTTKLFGGNPAAVVPLESWLSDNMLQNIASENNLSETAFFVPEGDGFHLRWFTPTLEIELCGHATLASAYVLFEILKFDKPNIRFNTMSGPLYVKKEHGQLSMDFPVTEMKRVPSNPHISAGLLAEPDELYESQTKFMAVYDSASYVYSMDPDFHHLKLAGKNVIITAKGEDCDFISRFFAPVSGIDEDPVTGSAHTALTPYWSKRLGKTELFAKQVSKRGGELICEISGERVIIRGNTRLYMTGELTL